MARKLQRNVAPLSRDETEALFAQCDHAVETLTKIVRAGRDAHEAAGRLGDVVRLLGAFTSANYTASSTDCEGYYQEFEGLLANEYRTFASRESYPQEADAYAELKQIALRLGELRLAPRLANRNICAVAGGFSSGKSSFLNALIGDDEDILPTQITPTTSIPTYIFHVDATLSVNAFNHYGGRVAIDARTFQQMTHDFKREHGVELKRLVHRVSIYTPALSSWANLALIDTPGYTNPENSAPDGAHGAAERDEDIALANVLKSPFLIWVVDCEKGTLPEQDIQFILKFMGERGTSASGKLYLVLNKGDKKTEQQRDDILRVAAENAKMHRIPFAGIGVFSSHEREWYANQGLSFDAFLRTVDEAQSSSVNGLEEAVQAVFQRYIDYHKREGEQLGKATGLLNRLALVLSGQDGGLEKLDTDLKKRRAYIRNAHADHEDLCEEAERLQKRFASVVRGFAESLGAPVRAPQAAEIQEDREVGPHHLHRVPVGSVAQSASGTPTVKAFLSKKQPYAGVDRVACFAYYLTCHRNTRQFTTTHIKELNVEAKQPKLANASSTVSNAIRKGLLRATTNGKQITVLGRRYVEALPDQAAAKALVEKWKKRGR